MFNMPAKLSTRFRSLLVIVPIAATTACSTPLKDGRAPAGSSVSRSNNATVTNDPFIWLEDRTAQRNIDWANQQSQPTLTVLKNDPNFSRIEAEVRKVALAKDRLAGIELIGDTAYNFWQDDQHVRGIWRRTSLKDYQNQNPKWETVIDLDALAKQENENWVWGNSTNCLAPKNQRCLISISRGGKDAHVVREFDLVKKDWVQGGFSLPEAKSSTSWIDENQIYVSTDFGPETISTSSYPIVTKLWQRGKSLQEAKEIFRGPQTDLSDEVTAYITPNGVYSIASRHLTFYLSENNYLTKTGSSIRLPFPQTANFSGIDDGRVFYLLREDLEIQNKSGRKIIPSGSLVSLPLAALETGSPLSQTEIVYSPTSKSSVSNVNFSQGTVVVDILENVKGRIKIFKRHKTNWTATDLKLPGDGVAKTGSTNPFSSKLVLSYTDFLTPYSILYANSAKPNIKALVAKQSPARFDSSDLQAEQWFAKSADGTEIPYFIVHKKSMKYDGENPTLQGGYGGFEVSETPYYLNSAGKNWAERGGVFVIANIRGGGEFGPKWHESAIGLNKQKSYDDFIAVSEDLIRRKVTSPRRLAIKGGSNGGLLVGAVFVERPDLYNGVLCEVPLLDMIRYPLLGAGSSWMGEYGDPNDPAYREAILKYSPYQNVQPGVKYPKVFLMTATSDDRVMPSHARKMQALMASYGHPTYYFEQSDGGHSGNANLEAIILSTSLEYTYLWRQLGDGTAK